MKSTGIVYALLGAGLVAFATYLAACSWNGKEAAGTTSTSALQTGQPCGAALQADPEATLSQAALGVAAALRGRSFADLLDSATVCLDEGEYTAPFVPGYDPVLQADAYSREERMLLCGWRLSGSRARIGAELTHVAVRDFHRALGRLPTDGAELAAWTELDFEGGDKSYLLQAALSAAEVEEIAYAINPVTGRLYSSFSDDRWSPGGVYLARIETPEELEAAFDGRTGFDASLEPGFKEAWLLKLFGDSPAEVLGSKPILTFSQLPGDRTIATEMAANGGGGIGNPCASAAP
jgi:hypothetical protein